MLINDILDLSKIESGTVVVDVGEVRLADLHELRRADVPPRRRVEGARLRDRDGRRTCPKSIYTDAKRLQQVIKNLLSNAFKFTQQGQVSLLGRAGARAAGTPRTRTSTGRRPCWPFSVTDTGIGISPDKQQIIFEAFQQADGSTSRKYGGTGLGLAISREISRLLGGEIRLVSSPGKGSTFTLYLPQTYVPPEDAAAAAGGSSGEKRRSRQVLRPRADAARAGPRDRPARQRGGRRPRRRSSPAIRCCLIVENDLAFARLLLDAAREKGFKGLVTSLGAAALALTREYKPDAITLDICLPDIDGWRVLDRLKNDMHHAAHPGLRHLDRGGARPRAQLRSARASSTKPLKSRETLDQSARHHPRASSSSRSRTWSWSAADRRPRSRLVDSIGGDRVPGHRGGERPGSAARLVAEARCRLPGPRLGTPPDMSVDDFLERIERTARLTDPAGDPLLRPARRRRVDRSRRNGVSAVGELPAGLVTGASARPDRVLPPLHRSTKLARAEAADARAALPDRPGARRARRC